MTMLEMVQLTDVLFQTEKHLNYYRKSNLWIWKRQTMENFKKYIQLSLMISNSFGWSKHFEISKYLIIEIKTYEESGIGTFYLLWLIKGIC